MRNAFAAELTHAAGKDERIVLLSGDIGNRLFNEYKARFPNRFFNCGVAEANMVGVAAGMALCGLRPITYTIASFNTSRCLEQIKIDICYSGLPVIIVGVGAGLSYAANGATHQSCEDIALMRILPSMTVICPGDVWEVRASLRAALELQSPVYIRLGKKNEPVVHHQAPDFRVGKAIVVREGQSICFVSTGNMLPVALESAQVLCGNGISVQVVSLHTVKPLDMNFLTDAFERFQVVVTVEEHSILGGLGGSIAEWLSARPPQKARLLTIGTDDLFLHEAGGQDYARDRFGLTPEKISEKTLAVYSAT